MRIIILLTFVPFIIGICHSNSIFGSPTTESPTTDIPTVYPTPSPSNSPISSFESCYEYSIKSSCYKTIITTDYSINCYGYQSCYSSQLITTSSSSSINCDGLESCIYNQGLTANNDSISCGGKLSCYYSNSIVAKSSIKCSGSYGCSYADNIESTSDDIYCDGDSGCYYAKGNISAPLGSVYCDGDFGCYNVSGQIEGEYVYCSGDYGCYNSANIAATNHVYCDGNYGCYEIDGTIKANRNVYVYGTKGAYSSDIIADGDIKCTSYSSCSYSNLTSGDDIYIQANYAAYTSSLTASDSVNCEGSNACTRSSINTDYLYSSGEWATYSTNIVAGVDGGNVRIQGYCGAYAADITAPIIYVYGSKGVAYADITQPDDSKLELYLYGYQSGYNSTIYCLQNDKKCYVYCLIENSCQGTEIIYSNLDNIEIDPSDCKSYPGTTNGDGIYCPKLTSYSRRRLIDREARKLAKRTEMEATDDYKNIEAEIAAHEQEDEIERQRMDQKRLKTEALFESEIAKIEDEISNLAVPKLKDDIMDDIF